MRKLFLTLIAVAAVFVGCEKDEVYDLDQRVNKLTEVVQNNYDELTATIDRVVAEQAEINHSLQMAINEEAAAREAGDLLLQKELANTAIQLRQELAAAVSKINTQMDANMEVTLDLLQQEADARTAGDVLLATSLAEEIADRLADDSEMKIAIMKNVNAIKQNASDIIANKNAIQENTSTLAKQLADNLAAQALLDAGDVDGLAELQTVEAALRYQIAVNMQGIKSNELEVVALAATTAEQFVNTMNDVVENAAAIADISDDVDYLNDELSDLTDATASLVETVVEGFDTVSTTLSTNLVTAITQVNSDVIELGDELDQVQENVNTTIANSIETVQDQVNDLSDSVNTLEESVGNPVTFNGYVTKIGETITVSGIAEQGDNVRIYVNGVNHIEYLNVQPTDVDKSGSRDGMLIEASVQAHAADVRVDAKHTIVEASDGGTMQLFAEGKAIEGLQEQVADIEEDVNALQEAALAALTRTVSITIAQWGDNNDTTLNTYSKSVSGEKEYVTFDIPYDHYFYSHLSAVQLPNDGSIKAGSPYYLGSAVVRLKFKIGKVDANQDGNEALTQDDAVNIETTVNQKAFLSRKVFPVWVDGDKSNVSAHPTKKLKLVINVSNTNARQVTIEQDADGDGVYENRKKWIGGGNHLGKRQDITNWLKNKARVREGWTDAEAAYYYQVDGYTTEGGKQVTTFTRANNSLKNTSINSTPLRKSFSYKTIRLEYSSSDFYTIEDNGGWKKVQRAYNAGVHDFDKDFYLPEGKMVLEDFEKELDIEFNGYYEGQGKTTVTGVAKGTAGDGFVTLSLKGMGTTNVTGRWDGILTNLTFSARKTSTEAYIGDICDYEATQLDPDYAVDGELKTNTTLHATYRGDIQIYDIPAEYLSIAENVGAGPFNYKLYNWDQDNDAWDKGYVRIGVAEIKSHALTNYAWSTAKSGIRSKFGLDHLIVLQGSIAGAYDVEEYDVNIKLQVWDTGCSNKTDDVTKNLRTAQSQAKNLSGRKVL